MGAFVEQLHSGRCGVERPDGDELFAADAERFSRRGEHLDSRGIAWAMAWASCGRAVDDVFAVVQDEKGGA